jgi:hypothetical protein
LLLETLGATLGGRHTSPALCRHQGSTNRASSRIRLTSTDSWYENIVSVSKLLGFISSEFSPPSEMFDNGRKMLTGDSLISSLKMTARSRPSTEVRFRSSSLISPRSVRFWFLSARLSALAGGLGFVILDFCICLDFVQEQRVGTERPGQPHTRLSSSRQDDIWGEEGCREYTWPFLFRLLK